MTFRYCILLLTIFCRHSFAQSTSFEGDGLEWKPGFLDIHFLHTGRGNSSFMIFPDGTTLLYDAGDAKQREKHPYYQPFDNRSISTGQRIAEYVEYFAPNGVIDYAVISHFHNDHYGEVSDHTPVAKNGAYRLTGITAVGDLIPIKLLIDRGFPNYNYPFDLRRPNQSPDQTLINYLRFINYHQKHSGMRAQALSPGINSQVVLRYDTVSFENFHVRNVKVNDLLWLGKEDDVAAYTFNPPLVNEQGYYNENPLSLSLKITYGEFDYFVGGDTPGVDDYPDYDLETPLANILGNVDALTLNHHGHKDATELFYITKMNPKVIAHQALHDPHFSDKVQNNLLSTRADVFVPLMPTRVQSKFKKQVKKSYKSTRGQFFIRVSEEGKTFHVIVLNPDSAGFEVKEKFGPYISE